MNEYVIYGFGRLGKNVLSFLQSNNKKVKFILDRNANSLSCAYKDYPIYKFEDVDKEQMHNTKVIIAISNPLDNHNIYSFLKQYAQNNDINIHIYMYSEGLHELCDCEIEKSNCLKCVWVEACPRFNQKFIDIYSKTPEKIINSLSLAVTNRCTLNCVGCVGCTKQIRQSGKYYDLTLSSLKKYMDTIFKEVECIHHLDVGGGEGLLSNELPEMLEYLSELKIGYIRLLTTATVKMSHRLLDTLKKLNILICVDDYGCKLSETLQEKVKTNLELLDKKGLIYTKIDNENGTWYNLGNFEQRSYETAKKNNSTCYFRKNLLLSPSGLLSWCHRNLSSIEYDLIPECVHDYCDLNVSDGSDIRNILDLEFLNACRYCNGTYSDNIIPSGIQDKIL